MKIELNQNPKNSFLMESNCQNRIHGMSFNSRDPNGPKRKVVSGFRHPCPVHTRSIIAVPNTSGHIHQLNLSWQLMRSS